MLDTGAACSVVRSKNVKIYREAKAHESLRTAGNVLVPILGTATINISLNNRNFSVVVKVIKNLCTCVLLGMDFLSENNVLLDAKNRSVTFRDEASQPSIDFCLTAQPSANFSLSTQPIVHFSVIADQELPQYEPTERKTVFKLQATEDEIFAPGETKRISITPSRAYKFYHRSLPNFKFLESKGFELCAKPRIKNKAVSLLVKSNNDKFSKIMAHTTLAFFYNKTKKRNDIFNCQNFDVNYIQPNPRVFNEDDFKINNELSEKDRKKVHEVIKDYLDVFSFDMSQLGRTNLIEYDIELTDENKVVQKRPYRVSLKDQSIINEQVENLLKYDIVEESLSPFASPVVLVKKKGGNDFRLAIDYRDLNQITKPTAMHPLPLIDDCLAGMYGCRYFSTLDCMSAYYQVPLSERAKERSAFVTSEGNYQFKVLPFGLTYAPGVWSLLVKRIFGKLKNKSVFVYLDDIIIFSKDLDSHVETLKEVFECLRRANLTLKPSKCQFLKTEIELLGFKISQAGIHTNRKLVEAVEKFGRPKNVKALQRFLGMAGFYRRFIDSYAKITRPLCALLKKDTKFCWDQTCQTAFETLKEKLCSAEVLAFFNPNAPTRLHVDASHKGLGAIMLQEQDDGEIRPVFYISRSLNKAEKNYNILNLEATCIIWALKSLRQFIHGRKITIITDHSALCYLSTLKNPTGRLARYLLILSEFDADIIHKKGKLNVDCDCLSRDPVSENSEQDNDDDELPLLTIDVPSLAELQEGEPYFANIKIALTNPNNNLPPATNRIAKNFVLIDDVLYKKNPSGVGFPNLLAVPQALKKQILYDYHNHPLGGGHLGFAKCYNKIKDRYFWLGLLKDVKNYVRSCMDCQLRKETSNQPPPGLLQPIRVGRPFEKISVDLLGPVHRSSSGKNFIIVVSDFATRYVESGALRDAKATTVARFIFQNIICRHGCPREILSDRGTVFRSELVSELLRILGIQQLFTTAYHPQCNGLTERWNKTVVDSLSLYMNSKQTDWDIYLPFVTLAYNSAKQQSTNFSPFLLVYGRDPRLPSDAALALETESMEISEFRDKIFYIRNQAVLNLEKVQGASKARYDRVHSYVEYKEGDLVKVFNPARKVGKTSKFLIKWHGPYTIVKKHTPVDYVVKLGERANSKTEVIHVSRIRPYRDSWLD